MECDSMDLRLGLFNWSLVELSISRKIKLAVRKPGAMARWLDKAVA